MSASASGWVEQGVGRLVGYIRRSERHRLGVVVGGSLLFLLLLVGKLGPELGLLPFGLAGASFVFLYTRPSAKATVTASAAGPGLLCLGLYVYQVFRPFEGPVGGIPEPITTTLLRHSHWLVIGTALLVLGAWLRRSIS